MQRASSIAPISFSLLPALLLSAFATTTAWSQETVEPAAPVVEESVTNDASGIESRLRFSFSGASWREVLDWLAEAAELSLYVDDVPTGSFTYSDRQQYTVDEAVARLNLFLLPRGYALVRRDELLSVINLGDPRGLQQLDAMAKVVPSDGLEGLNPHEVVKCFVPLGQVVASEAISEMQPLSLMTTPVTLPKSNQLIITDTVKNLRSALDVLNSMQQPQQSTESIRRFNLKHVDAQTVLMVAATHLGIPENAMSGIDITITTDLTGKRLFVVGSEEKLNRLEQLLKVVDVPDEAELAPSQQQLVSHPVTGDNLQVIYDVLQTILADKNLRLTRQEESNTIVALADPEVHQLIRETITELQAPSVEFSVVELGSVDPYFAVSLIGEMFGVPNEIPKKGEPEPKVAPPKVDADPGNRRLFVRGTADQIRQIEQLVTRLETRSPSNSGTDLRFVPLTGATREELLESAKQSWDGNNRLEILPTSESTQNPVIERTLHPESGTTTEPAATVPTQSPAKMTPAPRKTPSTKPSLNEDDLVAWSGRKPSIPTSVPTSKSTPPIRTQVVPNGILLQSDDVQALDQFERHLRSLSSHERNAISPTIVYYLKYVSAEEAVKMLADLLDGGNALSDTPGDTLVRGSVSGLGTFYGSLLFDRDGMTTVTAGTATIVSDARLNRLIVQGTKEDIATIENYMKIIDKDSSITEIETAGRSRIIALRHAKAEEVAEMIREAFPGRVDTSSQRGNPQAQQQNAPRPTNDPRGGEEEQRRVDDKPTRGNKPVMAVAVHEASNSLVITAPDSLFAEVQQLVESVDQRSERAVRVITAGSGVNLETIQQILSEQSSNASQRPRSNNRPRSSTPTRSNNSRGR
ncbi:secretin N-terminal domain-containing protein [Bremerella cremea]|uniref:secretin N-terminal domain-containing protein n=1 Tax=Bremerella cremea TaxID=1031537 RepID=UPI0031E71C62